MLSRAAASRTLSIVVVALFAAAGQAQIAERLGRGIYRFYPSVDAQKTSGTSLALAKPITGTPIDFRTAPDQPTFDSTIDQRFSAEIPIPANTDLYGTGEAAGPLRRNGLVTECWNSDIPGYSEKNPSLYQSHPWVLAVRKDGTAFGVLADTTYRCRIDLTKDIKFEAEGPPFPVIVIDRKTPEDVLEGLADLTGHMNLPPLWALGYHQCRWSYMSADEALSIAQDFRNRHIPCDTIWFDIDYMDGFRDFTFNPKTYPDPKGLNSKLASMGFHNVWMIDAAVKKDPGYPVYDSGEERDVFVKTASGQDFVGPVWPGDCVFPDFTSPETRAWWAGLYKPFIADGITGVWNDMNEPSVFNVPTKTIPEDALHLGGGDLKPGPHAQYHNAYGMLEARGTYEGILQANPTKRPFVLTRAAYIGYQRYAATWTGDNVSSWTDLGNAIPMVLNLGLSGQPFAGPDIPGFGQNGPKDEAERAQFFSRWWGLGAMLPFSRGHSAKGTERKEPWSFGPQVEEAARQALWRRYVMLPYLYTAFQEATTTGLPVARPLFFADLQDPALRSEDGGFLLGNDIAVQASVTPDSRPVYIPKGWVQLPLDTADPNLPTLWMRPGAIIPLGPPKQFTGEKPLTPLWLIVNLDADGKASGKLYEDEGDGFGYKKGDYLLSTYVAEATATGETIRISKAKGKRSRPARQLIVSVFKSGAWRSTSTGSDGKLLRISLGEGQPEKANQKVGPIYTPAS